MNRIPARNEEIVWRNLDGEAVLLNPHTGKYYGMNSVGCSFWEKVDGARTLGQITDLLFEEYDVERETLERDIRELVNSLGKSDIITLSD